ncbi:DUF309 domain-containing protein, partial [Streptomyces sp. adm13(2018)]|uniref:DUF309 domain-containing protein n=1 Tax=Streptomyces sp. adm13(2018) TaxID=2479007 RepID=UPI0021C6AC46
RLLDAGMPFHAHEVFEDAWKSGPASERDLWQGLAQLAVGLTHAAHRLSASPVHCRPPRATSLATRGAVTARASTHPAE